MSSTKNKIFQFKQFSVDQSDCGMKINTDGVLLGALAEIENPQQILDIGAGTGVIALMLAQRFPFAKIDAVEIDEKTAQTASENFRNSSFADRLELYFASFEDYLNQYPDKKYSLIISNPPFFIGSLKSETAAKELARHTNKHFFERLIANAVSNLEKAGQLTLILPLETADLVRRISIESGFHVQKQILIQSFDYSLPHRELLSFGFNPVEVEKRTFVIYDRPKEHSKEYQELLKDFFTIF